MDEMTSTDVWEPPAGGIDAAARRHPAVRAIVAIAWSVPFIYAGFHVGVAIGVRWLLGAPTPEIIDRFLG